jgi:quercetin dioxygenase-like cupin family protein
VGKITFRTLEESPEFVIRDRIPEGPLRDQIGDSELDNKIRMYFPGGPDDLQLFEAAVEPNCGPESHAHHVDEIIYVLQGEMHFGRRVLHPGSSVHIPAYTLYSFRAGANGLRFLNFRARANGIFITKDELRAVASRRSSLSGSD